MSGRNTKINKLFKTTNMTANIVQERHKNVSNCCRDGYPEIELGRPASFKWCKKRRPKLSFAP